VLPTDQIITPAGKLVPFEGRPTAIAIRPDGQTAAVLKSAGSYIGPGRPEHILIVDLVTAQVKQRFRPEDSTSATNIQIFQDPQGSFTGIVYDASGTKLYASDASGSIVVANVAADGTLSASHRIPLPVADPKRGSSLFVPDGRNTPNPGGLALSPDGRRLYVALNMNNSLAVIDLARNAVVDEISVGNAPHSVLVEGPRAYVRTKAASPLRLPNIRIYRLALRWWLIRRPGGRQPAPFQSWT
jgi:YVTN family beta-propeller protein